MLKQKLVGSVIILLCLCTVLYSSLLFGSALDEASMSGLFTVAQEVKNGVKTDIGSSSPAYQDSLPSLARSSLNGEDIYGGRYYNLPLYLSNKLSTMPAYKRVIYYRWFSDVEGYKLRYVPYPWIKLDKGANSEIISDTYWYTKERYIAYYRDIFEGTSYLAPSSESSLEDNSYSRKYLSGFSVDNQIYAPMLKETISSDGKYLYNEVESGDYMVGLEAELCGVQDHHVDEAAYSAWGVVYELDEGVDPTKVKGVWSGTGGTKYKYKYK